MRLAVAWLVFLFLLALYWVQLRATHADHLRAAEQGTALRGDQAAHALAMQTRSQLMKVEFLLEHLAHHWLDGDLRVYRDLIDVGQESIFNGALREPMRKGISCSAAGEPPAGVVPVAQSPPATTLSSTPVSVFLS